MSSFDRLIERIKRQIDEVDVGVVKARIEADTALVVVDVRERDEFVDGHIDRATLIPRGMLDMQIEAIVADKHTPIVLYCSVGLRSVLAARTLEELGYTDVVSMKGGMAAWKHAGYPVHVARALTQNQFSRYSRHLVIPEVGEAGQLALISSRVLLMGAGGLGSPVALYLAAAGVGTLGIIDSDVVDRSNLQRQIIHTDASVGMPKVLSAKRTLNALNPEVDVQTFETRLTRDNVLSIFEAGWDVVVDGGDNFPTRYLVNDACVLLGIPLVHGSVYRFEGQVTTFLPREGPCYRCLFPEPPPPEFAPSCQDAGVLGVLPGVIGLLQSIEVIKLLVGIGETLSGRLLAFDGLRTEIRELRFRPDPQCPSCAEGAVFEGFADYEAFCASV